MKIKSGKSSDRLAGIGLVILASICWATSSILINLIVRVSGISAISLAFWRDLFTSITLLLIVLVSRKNLFKIKRADLKWFILMGSVSIGLFHVLWNTSVVLFGASIATVLQSNAPIFVALIARLVYSEALTARKITAVIFSVIGTILCAGVIGSDENQITLTALVIGISSAAAYGTFPLFGRKLAGDYNPLTIMLYIFMFGTLTLLPFQFSLPIPLPIEPQVLVYFIIFVLVSTIGGFGIFTAALRYIPASIASIGATSEIVFASIFAYIILHERLDINQYFGILFVVSGVVLVTFPNANKNKISQVEKNS